jgi:hypothetical protein
MGSAKGDDCSSIKMTFVIAFSVQRNFHPTAEIHPNSESNVSCLVSVSLTSESSNSSVY